MQGVICLGGNFEGVREESFEGLDVPIVLTSVDSSIEISSNLFSCVGIDNEKAAYEATNYLIQKGHKHIGMILGDEFDAGVSNRRAIGYMRALEENHIPINKAYITLGGYDFEPAYESVKKLLSEEEHITAIFAISDIMAIGAGKAIIDLGYKIGEDISILGFDGLDLVSTIIQHLLPLSNHKGKWPMTALIYLSSLLKRNVRIKGVYSKQSLWSVCLSIN